MSSDTLLASSLLSNSHTLDRLDELFTVLRLFFGIVVGYAFNCERWFVAGTRRTEVGKGQPPASFQACCTLFQFPLNVAVAEILRFQAVPKLRLFVEGRLSSL